MPLQQAPEGVSVRGGIAPRAIRFIVILKQPMYVRGALEGSRVAFFTSRQLFGLAASSIAHKRASAFLAR